MNDTCVTVYAVLSKPNSMLGQAACGGEEKKKRAVQDAVIRSTQLLICTHAEKETSACLKHWLVCVECLHKDTHIHTYVWRQANTIGYSWLCQSVTEFSINNRKSTILPFCFFPPFSDAF